MEKYGKCEVFIKEFKSKKTRAEKFSQMLEELYPDAECALEYEGDPFRLLVMARLSAQCTDKRVNEVSKELFRVFPTAKSMAEGDIGEIEDLIRSCGLFRTKAKSIKETSRIIVEKFGGEVPRTKEELMTLPGVGMKIANLMMGDIFGDPHIVPDTHCIRISGRMGLVSKDNPDVCERELSKIIYKEKQSDFCHRIVLFGREFCKAQGARCFECPAHKFIKGEKLR